MHETFERLREWVPEAVVFEPSEFDYDFDPKDDDEVFYIKKEEGAEPFAVCAVDRAGRLKKFDYLDIDDQVEGKEKLQADVPGDIRAFIPKDGRPCAHDRCGGRHGVLYGCRRIAFLLSLKNQTGCLISGSSNQAVWTFSAEEAEGD